MIQRNAGPFPNSNLGFYPKPNLPLIVSKLWITCEFHHSTSKVRTLINCLLAPAKRDAHIYFSSAQPQEWPEAQ